MHQQNFAVTWKVSWPAAALIILTGCATTLPTTHQAVTAPREVIEAAYSFVTPDGQANVYIARPKKFYGWARDWLLYVDDIGLGIINNGSYQFVQLDPGSHTFTVAHGSDGKTLSSLTLEVEAGTNYFFEGNVTMGWVKNVVVFVPLSEEDGRAQIGESSLGLQIVALSPESGQIELVRPD